MTDISRHQRQVGVSMIEVMVGLAILGLLMALAVPSMKSFISKHKVSSIAAELVSDYYLARTEAVQRNQNVGIIYNENSAWTCYTIYTPMPSAGNCDCTLGVGRACTRANVNELKTVRIPVTSHVTVRITSDPVKTTDGLRTLYTGNVVFYPPLGLPPLDSAPINIFSIDGGQLKALNGVNGRQSICSPDQSMSGVPRC